MKTQKDKKRRHKLWQKLLAETFGTFALTFASAATAVLKELAPTEGGPLQHALAPALVVLALIYAIGDVSGAHFNPIVSVAFYLRRVFPGRLVVPYLAMQMLGSLLAGVAVLYLLGDVRSGITEPKSSVAVTFGMEVLLSALLVTVILGTATKHRIIGANAAVPIGCTITVCGLMGDAISGASMNPARSFGPAIVSGQVQYLWLYWIAPLIGAVTASALTWALHRHQHDCEQEAAEGS